MKTISKALCLALFVTAGPAQADIIDDFPQVEGVVGDMMIDELGDLITRLPDLPPIIDCGCPHLCGFIAKLARGDVPGDQAQAQALTAMLRDKADGVAMALEMEGKFVPEYMGRVHIAMTYADGYDAKRAADLLRRAGEAVLR